MLIKLIKNYLKMKNECCYFSLNLHYFHLLPLSGTVGPPLMALSLPILSRNFSKEYLAFNYNCSSLTLSSS